MFLDAAQVGPREVNADGGHWYYPDGRPCHTVERADGSGERNTTLRDARKLGLLPSVTTITKIVDNPGLSRWKQDRLVQACIDNPISPGENPDSYRERIKQAAQRTMIDARVFGSKFHAAVETLANTGYIKSEYEDIWEWVAGYCQWVKDNDVRVLQAEVTCVNNRVGYAGQLDAVAKVRGVTTLIDYKSQSVGEGKKPNFYDSWGWQLAAYREANWPDRPIKIKQVISLAVNSQRPGEIWEKVWTRSELNDAWKAFRYSAKVWQATNSYTPGGRKV